MCAQSKNYCYVCQNMIFDQCDRTDWRFLTQSLRLEVLTAIRTKKAVFWVVAP
jgi:hypothetical protein